MSLLGHRLPLAPCYRPREISKLERPEQMVGVKTQARVEKKTQFHSLPRLLLHDGSGLELVPVLSSAKGFLEAHERAKAGSPSIPRVALPAKGPALHMETGTK